MNERKLDESKAEKQLNESHLSVVNKYKSKYREIESFFRDATTSLPMNVSQNELTSQHNDEQTCTEAKRPRQESSQKASQLKPFSTKYFEEITHKAGLKIGTENHVLNCDKMTFVSNLKKTLENNVDFPRNVLEFMKGFKNCSESVEQFISFTNGKGIHDHNDSILRLLLKVTCLQDNLLQYIMERATEVIMEDRPACIFKILRVLIYFDDWTEEEKVIEGLLDLLEVASGSNLLEIIARLPDIVAHLKHDKIVLKLLKLLSEDVDNIGPIADTLSCLTFSADLKTEVVDQVFTVLQMSTPPRFIPNVVTFLLPNLGGVDHVLKLRDALDWPAVGLQTEDDIASSKVLTVLALQAAIRSETLSQAWLKVIKLVEVDTDHKPIDFIILLLMFRSSFSVKFLERIFRQKIKSFLFTCQLLDDTFKMFKPALREYLTEMLRIAKFLLRCEPNDSVIEFGTHWFILMFRELEDCQKEIMSELVPEYMFFNYEVVSIAVKVLMKIAKDDLKALKPLLLKILIFAEVVQHLEINSQRRVMDLLCGLAYGDQDSLIGDEVRILIPKMLNGRRLNDIPPGVMGAVMAVKHSVFRCPPQDASSDDNSYSEVSDLPEGAPKVAALMIEQISKSLADNSDMMCFFYDELSALIMCEDNVDYRFLNWLSQSITDVFQDNFIVDVEENVLGPVKEIPLSAQFCLNVAEEEETQVALNIANIILRHETYENCKIGRLPSLFRLVQLIHSKQCAGDLSTVDALLGCSVIMPKFDYEEGLGGFPSARVNNILNCFFNCINWFRELINAFHSQESLQMRKKVIERLNGLIALEKHFAVFIKNNPAYEPPKWLFSTFSTKNDNCSQSILEASKSKKSRKTIKQKPVIENYESFILSSSQISNAALSDLAKQQSQKPESSKSSSSCQRRQIFDVDSSKCKPNTIIFRELNLGVFVIFKEDLIMESHEGDCLVLPDSTFNLDILIFLMNEFIPKLSSAIPSIIKKKALFKRTDYSFKLNIKAIDMVDKCLAILPRICHHMEAIAELVQKSLDENEGIRENVSMISEKHAEAQLGLSCLFQMLTIIFSWTGFQTAGNDAMLIEGLKALACRRDTQNATKSTVKELVSEASIYASKYKDWCFSITTAVNLVYLVEALSKLRKDRNMNNLKNLSSDMISMSWRDVLGISEKGLTFNRHVDSLLCAYFAKPKIDEVKSLTWELIKQAPQLKGKCTLSRFPCINKSNFPLLFRATCNALYEAATSEIEKRLTDKQHLELWKNVSVILKDLVDIIKAQVSRTNLLSFLRKVIPIFKLFLSQGMPTMGLKVLDEPDAVAEVLRSLQYTTRFLHMVQCHSRLKKDPAFANYLPKVKILMETLVFRVRGLLTASNCSEIIWMGTLKHRNLQGETFLSQKLVQTDSEKGEEEGEEEDEEDGEEGEEESEEEGEKNDKEKGKEDSEENSSDDDIFTFMEDDMLDPELKSLSNVF